MKGARRSSRLLLRLWILSLATFLGTALVSLTLPDVFFHSPLRELRQRELGGQIDQLALSLHDPALLQRQVDFLSERAGVALVIRAGEHELARSKGELPSQPDMRTLREAARGQPAIVASYSLERPPGPPPIDRRHLLATCTIVVLGGLVHALLLRKLVTHPLLRLIAAAETFDAGRLDARAGLAGHDEFAELGRAFDDMATRIANFVGAQRELLGNVSHELRTPLARIRVVIDTLEATGEPELIGELHEEVDELQALVETLLEAVSVEADGERGLLRGGFAPIDPSELLDLAARRFERAHPGRVLIRAWSGELPRVSGNLDALARVLANLLDNAAKYSPNASPITLAADHDAGSLDIAVIDRGIGIAASDLPRIFEPFFRAERSRSRDAGGAGLGLAIVERLVARHGGRVEVLSSTSPEAQAGTTIRVRLPTIT